MSTIRVVWGSASAPTAMSSYDAALADAGVENYNLVSVSSVIPEEVAVEAVGTAPDLGPAGNRLTVVESRATTGPDTGSSASRVSAALAWARSLGDGPGLFYEAADETGSEDVEERVREGLAAGQELREWTFDEPRVAVESSEADPGTYTTAVVIAAYGGSVPIIPE
ncbi:pyruvoyl-dependent arginine decarboxylase [Natrarchaeobius halalkaliphilus]|uniref:arginine decarboxylase n=1 Tax=Natrarchaeobius halalkaliphilus TaxID=1679091 RepID=A0A3N6M1V8_9EURY|nr:pyruvoyl-dependent arginine decarboxylase [Natrarchaeobius halalkaliphilus]RQG89071.1 pyruvoyl-dependent arginine decarboxylase [Natrarchaeobius halalkaliphilus]